MTRSFASRLAFAFVLSSTFGAAAQSPPTAQFPVEPAPSGSAAAPAPSSSAPPAAPGSAAPAPSVAPAAPSAPPPASSVAPPAPAAPAGTAAAPTAPARVTPPPPPPVTTPNTTATIPGALVGVPPPTDAQELPLPALGKPQIGFEREPGWAVELDGRAGVGILARSDARGAFVFAGGLLRGHYRYFELGAFYDHADKTDLGGTFSHAGGFAGAWVPFKNWVDFDFALGFGARRYTDSDPRYGAGGYAVSCPALSLLLGVSDRARSGNAGGRFGGQLVLTQDLGQKNVPWTFTQTNDAGESVSTGGTTHVGGFSASLVFTLGFDFGTAP